MNLDEQKITGTNQISVTDSLEAPLLSIKVSRTANTTVPSTSDLIVYVDTAPKSTPTSNRKQFVFELASVLGYASSTSDQFVLEVVPKGNDIVADVYVTRKVSGTSGLSTPTKEVLEESLINLFDGTNYIYTNYTNDTIEIIYPKDDELNRRYLNNAIFCHHRQNNSGDFSLDDIYFKDAFTKTEDKLNIEVDNAEISTLTSKNNKFSLDANGNLVVNSITTNSSGEGQALNNTAICNLIYPVGSIYMSVNSTSPSTLFGGTWTQLKDRFLLGAGDTYSNGSTGGSATLQSHTHTIPSLSGTAASTTHSHIVTTKTTTYAQGSQSAWRCLSWPGTNTDYTQTVYTNNGTADGAHTHTVTTNASNTGSAGDGTSGNMPPYLTVYMWKRTA